AGRPSGGRAALRPSGPGGQYALRRRGAAREARQGARAAGDREDALRARRAHNGAPLRRRPAAARGTQPARRYWGYRAFDRAQPGRREGRRLGRRPRAGGGRGWGTPGRIRYPGADREAPRIAYRALSAARALLISD